MQHHALSMKNGDEDLFGSFIFDFISRTERVGEDAKRLLFFTCLNPIYYRRRWWTVKAVDNYQQLFGILFLFLKNIIYYHYFFSSFPGFKYEVKEDVRDEPSHFVSSRTLSSLSFSLVVNIQSHSVEMAWCRLVVCRYSGKKVPVGENLRHRTEFVPTYRFPAIPDPHTTSLTLSLKSI